MFDTSHRNLDALSSSHRNLKMLNNSQHNLVTLNGSKYNLDMLGTLHSNLDLFNIPHSNLDLFNISQRNLDLFNISHSNLDLFNISHGNVDLFNISHSNFNLFNISHGHLDIFNISHRNLGMFNISQSNISDRKHCHCVWPGVSQLCRLVCLVHCFGRLPLIAFGLVFNTLALLTLRQPRLKESPFVHLRGLTTADLVALLLVLLDFYKDQTDHGWQLLVCYLIHPVSNMAAVFSIWILVVVSLERCIFMQFPIWAPIWCTNSSAKFKVMLVTLSSCVINFPRFFWYGSNSVPNNSSLPRMNSSQGVETYIIVRNWQDSRAELVLACVYSLLQVILPVVMLIVFNSFLIFKIRTQQKRRARLRAHNQLTPRRSQEQTRLTITLVATSGLYAALILPAAVSEISILELLQLKTGQVHCYQFFSNLLIYVNLSFNFLMYSFINVKFQRAFVRMVRQWLAPVRTCLIELRLMNVPEDTGLSRFSKNSKFSKSFKITTRSSRVRDIAMP